MLIKSINWCLSNASLVSCIYFLVWLNNKDNDKNTILILNHSEALPAESGSSDPHPLVWDWLGIRSLACGQPYLVQVFRTIHYYQNSCITAVDVCHKSMERVQRNEYVLAKPTFQSGRAARAEATGAVCSMCTSVIFPPIATTRLSGTLGADFIATPVQHGAVLAVCWRRTWFIAPRCAETILYENCAEENGEDGGDLHVWQNKRWIVDCCDVVVQKTKMEEVPSGTFEDWLAEGLRRKRFYISVVHGDVTCLQGRWRDSLYC